MYQHLADLNETARRIFECAKAKGFKDEEPSISIHLMNLHSEISELWEAYRNNKLTEPCDKATKMQDGGIEPLTYLEEELADIIIRALDTAHTFGVDIDRAVKNKMAYNRTRPHKHGGKRA